MTCELCGTEIFGLGAAKPVIGVCNSNPVCKKENKSRRNKRWVQYMPADKLERRRKYDRARAKKRHAKATAARVAADPLLLAEDGIVDLIALQRALNGHPVAMTAHEQSIVNKIKHKDGRGRGRESMRIVRRAIEAQQLSWRVSDEPDMCAGSETQEGCDLLPSA